MSESQETGTLQLVIQNPTEEQLLESYEIIFNFEELKNSLEERLQKYQGLVYSDSEIALAKKDRAALNKFKEAMETRRREIKTACLKPYEDFEKKIKELVGMVDKPISEIDKQVKAFEKTKKDEKKEVIRGIYDELIHHLADVLPFDTIFNEKWLNVSTTEKAIRKEMAELFNKVETDLLLLKELGSEYYVQLQGFYLAHNYDLTLTIQEEKRLKEQAEKLAEHNRRVEEAKAEPGPAPSPAPKSEPKQQFAAPPVSEPGQQEAALPHMDFRVWGTKEELMGLATYMRDKGLKFGRIPERKGE